MCLFADFSNISFSIQHLAWCDWGGIVEYQLELPNFSTGVLAQKNMTVCCVNFDLWEHWAKHRDLLQLNAVFQKHETDTWMWHIWCVQWFMSLQQEIWNRTPIIILFTPTPPAEHSCSVLIKTALQRLRSEDNYERMKPSCKYESISQRRAHWLEVDKETSTMRVCCITVPNGWSWINCLLEKRDDPLRPAGRKCALTAALSCQSQIQ